MEDTYEHQGKYSLHLNQGEANAVSKEAGSVNRNRDGNVTLLYRHTHT